jgi:hypothetical protein
VFIRRPGGIALEKGCSHPAAKDAGAKMTTQLLSNHAGLRHAFSHAHRQSSGRDAEATPVDVSFVIPLKDEEATIVELYERIAAQFESDVRIEFIFIDDGSRDGSWATIRSLVARDPSRVRGLKFRRNCGKAAALTAGFRAANGSVIFTLDADLQDDPAEIHRFLEKLGEGFDLVSGWKRSGTTPGIKSCPAASSTGCSVISRPSLCTTTTAASSATGRRSPRA